MSMTKTRTPGVEAVEPIPSPSDVATEPPAQADPSLLPSSNADNVQHALGFLERLIRARCSEMFGDPEDAAPVELPELGYFGDASAFSRFIEEHEPTLDEYVVVLLALVPHVAPSFIDGLLQELLPAEGDFPQIGGRRDENRVFVPTGETAVFLLAGDDLDRRFEVQSLFLPDHRLSTRGIVKLEPAADGEPVLSGRLVLDRDYVELFTFGHIATPAFGSEFPAKEIHTELEWSDLVLPDDVRLHLEGIRTWIEHSRVVMDDLGMRAKLAPGYRCLFHGVPGVGKTLAAKLLGKYTQRRVFRVDLSMVTSKYIGETEKNLAALFDRAQSRDWILFFDEADALFGKRTDVKDSHDKYANQEASYLLQRVEDFDGLVILASNFKANLDEAFLRRFNQVIRFPFPSREERETIWRLLFPAAVRFEDDRDLAREFSAYELAGGSIVNIVHYACLQTAARGGDHVILAQDVLDGTRMEIEKSGKAFRELPAPK